MSLWTATDNAGGKPKFLTTTEKNFTVGIKVEEAQQTQNRDKGFKTPGWVKYNTYTDAQGNTRHKAETLVAFGGDMTGDNDALPAVPVITIGTQPLATSVTAPDTATFTVAASATNSGVLSYQWQKQEGGAGAWGNIVGATSASYTTPATVVATDNGDKYRVVVSATLGAQSVTSNAVTLTVTA